MGANENNDGTPASSQKSKAEQLARIRRNQQRCRERKRTHVAELESQVEALRAKIRQCEPCVSPSPPEQESALDTAVRENAARRDLLSALGFDDETQQRFIESGEKRQAVYTILREERDRTTPYSNLEVVDGGGNRSVDVLDPAVANWFMSAETLDKLPPALMEPANDIAWLTESYNDYANLPQGLNNISEPADAMLALGTAPEPSLAIDSNGLQWDSTTTSTNGHESGTEQSVERCFMDTVVQFQPGETSTVCSKALALVFRYNRKGFSMAALQSQLKPGMRAPCGTSGECRVENSVLFRVLANIST